MSSQPESVLRIVAEALGMFSLSLVKVVCGFLAFPAPSHGARPKLLFKFGRTSATGVACNIHNDNEIWIATGAHRDARVSVFSSNGVHLRDPDFGHVRMQWPCGIAFAKRGEAFVVDCTAHNIVMRTSEGKITVFDARGTLEYMEFPDERNFSSPMFIAVDQDKELLFVTDMGNNRVQVFNLMLSEDGESTRVIPHTHFGSFGGGDAQFYHPHGIALNSAGEVGIVDRYNDRVQVFDYPGKFLRKFGSSGSQAGHLNMPIGLACDASRNWIVCDTQNQRVCVFSSQGSFITSFGEYCADPDAQFHLYCPSCVCVDGDGRILVGDHSGTVKVFAFQYFSE